MYKAEEARAEFKLGTLLKLQHMDTEASSRFGKTRKLLGDIFRRECTGELVKDDLDKLVPFWSR